MLQNDFLFTNKFLVFSIFFYILILIFNFDSYCFVLSWSIQLFRFFFPRFMKGGGNQKYRPKSASHYTFAASAFFSTPGHTVPSRHVVQQKATVPIHFNFSTISVLAPLHPPHRPTPKLPLKQLVFPGIDILGSLGSTQFCKYVGQYGEVRAPP